MERQPDGPSQQKSHMYPHDRRRRAIMLKQCGAAKGHRITEN
jgi:hypothetical protein